MKQYLVDCLSILQIQSCQAWIRNSGNYAEISHAIQTVLLKWTCELPEGSLKFLIEKCCLIRMLKFLSKNKFWSLKIQKFVSELFEGSNVYE